MSAEIDFLPVTYYEAGVQRKNFTLRIVVAGAFLAMIAAAILFQQHLRNVAEAQLNGLLPQYYQAVADGKRLSELQRRIHTAEKQAELCTYLQHPWPRSRILATLSESLPDEIELEKISVSREIIPIVQEQGHATPVPSAETQTKLDPAEHDLLALRDEWDKSQVVVTIAGTTEDPVALHQYLEQLNRSPLFSKVNLNSEEQASGDASGHMRFVARILVKAGYGQPNGPKGPEENTTQREIPKSKV